VRNSIWDSIRRTTSFFAYQSAKITSGMSTNKSFDKPLASFDTEKDACNYAYDIAKTENGFTLPVEGSSVS
jgi:hypothetical protein